MCYITFCINFINLNFLTKKLGADAYPEYIGPFTVFVEMQTGSYFAKKLEEKKFSANELPVNWMRLRNNSTHFEDYSVFIQTSGHRRFVSKARRVHHIAQSTHDSRQPLPIKAHVHLDEDLWLETEPFHPYSVNTQRDDHHYSNCIFVTIPQTHLIYTAPFKTIVTPRPPQRPLRIQTPQLPDSTIPELLRILF